MGDKTYTNYFKRLKGETVLTHDGDPDAGFYRLPERNGRENGNKITGWKTVAYFYSADDGRMVGTIGDRDMKKNEVTDLWTYVCAYPVPEDIWRKVDAGQIEWPRNLIGEPKQAHRTAYAAPIEKQNERAKDLMSVGLTGDPGRTISVVVQDDIPAADRVVSKNDNAPPEELPNHEMHAQKIDAAIKAAVSPITTEEQKAEATGRKNLIAELRLAADKDGKALYQPVFNEYKRIYNQYAPLVSRAEAREKEITRAVLTFDENERKRIAKQKADDETKRLADEQAAKDAAQKIIDRAIEKGMPPAEVLDPGEEAYRTVGTTLEPAFEAPAPIAPTYGTRQIKGSLKKFAEIKSLEDQAKVYDHFKSNPEVTALLLKLAQAQVTAGFDVPGITVREGLI